MAVAVAVFRLLADRSGEEEEIVRSHLFDIVHSDPRRLANRFDELVKLLGERLFFLDLIPDVLNLLLDLPLDLLLDVLFDVPLLK